MTSAVPPGGPLPTMSESQRIGMMADRAFRNQLADYWIDSGSAQNDYGWDYWISIASRRTGQVGPDLFVQLKGTGCPDVVADGEFISQPLDVATVNYLRDRSCPALLAVCDVEEDGRPVYWVWLDEALKAVGRAWWDQVTVTLRVPKNNRLRLCHTQIEEEAERWLASRAVDKALAEAAALAVPDARDGHADAFLRARSARQRAIAAFAQADLVDADPDAIEGTTLSEAERAIRANLRDAKALIDAFDDTPATAKLAEIERELESVEVGQKTRAIFDNRKGVLALRQGQYQAAISLFGKAAAAMPADERYQCNLVVAEALASGYDSARREDWLRTLDELLTRKADCAPALAMKTRLLATEDPRVAEDFLRSSSLWSSDRGEAQLLLADVLSASNPDRALAELDLLPQPAAQSSEALSMRGFLLFRKAVGEAGTAAVSMRGFGPANLDLFLLGKAAEAYEQACRALAALHLPRFAADVFRNAAQVLVVAGRSPAAVRWCESYLNVHPDSTSVRQGAAVALGAMGRHDEAVAHLIVCADQQPDDGDSFRNLLLALYAADRFDELRARAEKRLTAPQTRETESLCREFLALACAETGDFASADLHLRALSEIDEAAAVPATAVVRARAGRAPEEIRSWLREASSRWPADGAIATHLVLALLPVSAASAEEIRTLLEQRVAPSRQLSPREVQWLGRAYAELGDLPGSEAVFRGGLARFRDDASLQFDLAVTLADLGRFDEAYSVMTEAGRGRAPSAAAQQNLALLAAGTGRLDQAISLFEQACGRTTDPSSRRALAGQLYELRRRRGDGAKDLLRAAMAFGDRRSGELTPDLEARFLMMALLAGTAAVPPGDEDVARWSGEVQARLTAFCDRYPKHQALQRFTIPDGIQPQDLETLLFSEIYAQAYPSILLGQQLEIAARGVPYPLCVRARRLVSSGRTTLSYWQECVRSDDRAHRVHCVIGDANDIKRAEQAVAEALGGWIVVDLTGLLTLKHCGLLDEALRCFRGWILANETRRTIEIEAAGVPQPDELARELDDWVLGNRERVITRRLPRRGPSEVAAERYLQTPSGLWAPQAVPEPALLPDGIGASMMLAAQLGVPLFTDEGVVQEWARQRKVRAAFGTVAFLSCLRARGNLALENEAVLLSKLIQSNYRNLPYGAPHVHAAIRRMLEQPGARPTVTDLNDDAVVGVLLRQVGDPQMDADSVAGASGEIVALCVRDEQIPTETTAELAYSLSFKNWQRAPGGVLAGATSTPPEAPLARMWLSAIVRLYANRSMFICGWALMRQTVSQLCRNAGRSEERILATVANSLVAAIVGAPFDDDARNSILLRIASDIPEDDRGRWLAAMARVRPSGQAAPGSGRH